MPGEVVVIGGGVIGLSVAFELLSAGRRVRVAERDRCGSGTSRAAAGMLAPVSEAETAEPELVRFGQDSLGRYPEFVRAVEAAGGGSCGYRTDGTLWAAIDRDNAEEIDRLAETLRLKGLTACRLGPREIGELEPHFSPRVEPRPKQAGQGDEGAADPNRQTRVVAKVIQGPRRQRIPVRPANLAAPVEQPANHHVRLREPEDRCHR